MDRETFREQMLGVMERKKHWAWPMFTSGRVARELLHYHFEQEYETYVRDFPVMVGRAYVRCPIPAIRRSLAENLYEEETGGLVAGSPHPVLFLEYPRGLGMDLKRFEHVQLLPAAERYRAFLEEATQCYGWDIAAAIVTIFVEGNSEERAALTRGEHHAPGDVASLRRVHAPRVGRRAGGRLLLRSAARGGHRDRQDGGHAPRSLHHHRLYLM